MAPELFTLPGLGWPVTAYGLGIGAALVSAWLLALVLARRDRLPSESLGTVFVLSAIVGLLAARASHLAQTGQSLDLASLRTLPAGGLSLFGGMVGALVVSALGCARSRVPLLAWLDCAAPAFALGAVFERVGAFVAGADFGVYVAPGDWGHALAVRYPPGTPVYQLHAVTLQGLPGVSESASAPVHPVQLYTALFGLLALVVAVWLRRRRRFSGQVFLAVLALFLLGRAVLLEPLRFGASPPVLGPLRLAQVSGLGLLVVIGAAHWLLAGRAASRPDGMRFWEGGPWSPRA